MHNEKRCIILIMMECETSNMQGKKIRQYKATRNDEVLKKPVKVSLHLLRSSKDIAGYIREYLGKFVLNHEL
jgi:hypothetical protein